MWFGLLGSLLVRYDDTVVAVPAGKQRVVLAALLLRANQVVSFDELADLVWDGEPPPAMRATVRNHVMRLRQALGPEVAARLRTQYPGYLVEVGPDEVDVTRFADLCAAGGAAARAGQWDRVDRLLTDALAVYQDARRILVGELGVEPGAELRQLQQRILAGEEAGDAAETGAGVGREAPGPRLAVPAQLPPDLVDFTGRDRETKVVCDALSSAGLAGEAGTVAIVTVSGAGGIGKTALAVHAAHRLRDQFAGGQLYLSLRGGAGRPVPAIDALGRLLRDLGTPTEQIPSDEDERAARFRSLVRGAQVPRQATREGCRAPGRTLLGSGAVGGEGAQQVVEPVAAAFR